MLSIHPDNPEGRKIKQVAETLERGGVIVYPTDTVYGLGCDIMNTKAVEKICRIRGLDARKANLTFICQNIGQLAIYTQPIGNQVFKMLKRNLPGPFTFILPAGSAVPKVLKNRRKTIGVRIPDNKIAQAILAELGRPILSISLKAEDEILEYLTDPIDIEEDLGKQVDLVIDGGIGGNQPSTVVDCTQGEIQVIREGVGELV